MRVPNIRICIWIRGVSFAFIPLCTKSWVLLVVLMFDKFMPIPFWKSSKTLLYEYKCLCVCVCGNLLICDYIYRTERFNCYKQTKIIESESEHMEKSGKLNKTKQSQKVRIQHNLRADWIRSDANLCYGMVGEETTKVCVHVRLFPQSK